MPQERVTMRQIREILRLVWSCGQSRKNTAIACGVGKTTVTDTVARATAAGLTWPLPTIDDEALERLLYPPVKSMFASVFVTFSMAFMNASLFCMILF